LSLDLDKIDYKGFIPARKVKKSIIFGV